LPETFLRRETLENDVREFLYTRLDSEWAAGKWGLSDLTRFLENLARRPANIAYLAIMYHLFRSGGAESFFTHELPSEVHRPSHATRRERTVGRKIPRGHVDWSHTLSRQMTRLDPTVFAVNQAVKEYDSQLNRLLAHYVRQVWNALNALRFDWLLRSTRSYKIVKTHFAQFTYGRRESFRR
jgi:hypothetical protein